MEMDNAEIQQEEIQEYFLPFVPKVRFILMVCAILYTYGSYDGLGDINGIIFGFAFPALFIISGYLVMRDPDMEQRILRTIGRTAICFGILFVVDVLLSLALEYKVTVSLLSSARFWFNFLVLNTWGLPVGSTIWYVQALLYAYIIVFVLSKLKLLRFDIIIAAVGLVVAVLTGELAGVIGFNFLGYTYLGGNFFTRALPYILVGGFVQKHDESFGTFPMIVYDISAVIGIGLAFAEYFILGATGYKVYVGHTVGMGIVAFALCMNCFYTEEILLRSDWLRELSRAERMLPYFVASPLYYLILIIPLTQDVPAFLRMFAGLSTTILSFAAFGAYLLLRFLVREAVSGILYAIRVKKGIPPPFDGDNP